MLSTTSEVPLGARAFVVSDLLLTSVPGASGEAATADLIGALDAWDGPGAVVFAGGLFDMLRDREARPAAALAAHPRLTEALRRYGAMPGRSIVWLPGPREAPAQLDPSLAAELADAIPSARTSPYLDLHVATSSDPRMVRVVPGVDCDPRVGTATYGERALTDVAQTATRSSTWLADVDRLRDVRLVPRFMMSRMLYRRLARWSWLVFLPFLLALALKVPLSFVSDSRLDRALGPLPHRLQVLLFASALDFALVLVLALLLLTRGWHVLVGPAPVDGTPNDTARDAARSVLSEGGTGLIAGHTQAAELTRLGSGFFACPGACTEVVIERPARLGLPPVFASQLVRSWIELDAGVEMHVRLLYRTSPGGTNSNIERLAMRKTPVPSHPEVVASFPDGESWPVSTASTDHAGRIRRRAAAVVALAGLVNLAAVATPPIESRLRWLLRWVPLAVPEAATAVVALTGLGLMLLARGVRTGQRDAWRVATGLLMLSVALHAAKGADIEEGLLAAFAAGYMLRHRSQFKAARDHAELKRRLAITVFGVPAIVAGSAAAIEAVTAARGRRLPIGQAIATSAQRLVGVRHTPLPRRLDEFLSPSLFAVGIGIGLWLAWLLVRPVGARRSSAADYRQARAVVLRWGAGTLDYFALRTDKEFFFNRNSVVAYAVHSGVCLVSPDPIGPEWEHDAIWDAFRSFADARGWVVGVLGAAAEWLPTYRRSGMHDLYVGDEGVVDVAGFSLQGRRNKGPRQAYNRIANHGYSIAFHDPAHIDPAVERGVRDIMHKGRRGEVERGFSMTLGRVFDPADEGLLLAVCSDSDGTPVSFCQYVPAPGIGGYSLDLMRRDDGDHPNGLLEYVIVATILHLRDRGLLRLGLNFATMRALLAGEVDETTVRRIERWALRRMSDSMQIESLWRFNAKFYPNWHSRFVVYDSREHLVPVALAVARAESFWELPVIGRFLTPNVPGQRP